MCPKYKRKIGKKCEEMGKDVRQGLWSKLNKSGFGFKREACPFRVDFCVLVPAYIKIASFLQIFTNTEATKDLPSVSNLM